MPDTTAVMPRPSPLAGLRVLAVEQFGAGPFGTMYLADLGAEVIKVEDPSAGGDVGRYVPPGQAGSDSLYFESFNRGKRSIALDLKVPAGREVFERLVAGCDVVFSNLRGDQAERLGLTYAALGAINPRVVCVALTGYGRTGARAVLPSYDALIQAETGWASLTGDPADPPTKSGLSLADYVGGLTAMLGALAAVIDARGTGVGRDVDVNLYDAALAMLSYQATWHLSRDVPIARQVMSAHPSLVPFQFFPTADGHVAVACAKEKFFRDLVVAVDRAELQRDQRFASFASRLENRAALLEILGATFRTRTTAAWLEALRGIVPIAPVRSIEEALDRSELVERDMLASYVHPNLGAISSIGVPITMSGFAPDYRPGPLFGGDRDGLLASVGYDAAACAALAQRGAFGTANGADSTPASPARPASVN